MIKYFHRLRMAFNVLTQGKYKAMVLIKVDNDAYLGLLGKDINSNVKVDTVGMPMYYVRKMLTMLGKNADNAEAQIERMEFEQNEGIYE